MATITVDLKAITGSFETDIQRASRTAQKEFAQMVDTAKQIGAAFGTALAAGVTAVTALAKASIDAADHMNDLAKKAGISAQSMSELGYVAARSGSDVDSLAAGLVKMAKNAADAAAGGKENAATFAAIGVSLRDAQGNLKGTDTLFKDIAEKFANFKEGPDKIALAIKIFGKSGADLAQTLNNGKKGIDELIGSAHELGAVISNDLASQADEFNDTLADLHSLVEGTGNAIAEAVLPVLKSFADLILDAGKKSKLTKDDFSLLADAFKAIGVGAAITKNVIEAVVGVLGALGSAASAAFDLVKTNAQGAFDILKSLASGSLTEVQAATEKAAKDNAAALGQFTTTLAAATQAGGSIVIDSINDVKDAYKAAYDPAKKANDEIARTGDESKRTNVPLSALGDGLEKARDAYEKAGDAAAKFLASLSTSPLQQALNKYVAEIIEANNKGQDLAKTGHSLAEVQQFLEAATKGAHDELEKTTDEIARQADVFGEYQKQLNNDKALIGLSDREIEITQAVQAQQKVWEENKRQGVTNKQTLDELTESVRQSEGAFYDQKKAMEAAKEQAESYQHIIGDAFNSVADVIGKALTGAFKSFKDFGSSLLDIAKQVVAELIAQFIKLRVIAPILASLFGGSGTAYGQSLVESVAGSALGGGGAGGSIFDALGSAFSGGGNFLGNLGSMASTFWFGHQIGGASPMATLGGYTGGDLGFVPDYLNGAPGAYMSPSVTYGGYGSALGQGLGIAGGLYAGYNRFKSGGGIAGGATYAAGTYALGAGISSAVAGTGFAAGVGGAFGAVPVVGWIALAAMLIDHFSGGKLFGTKYQTKEATSNLSISTDGGVASVQLYQEGQKSLFRGTKRRTISGTPTQDMIDAANQFYADLKKARDEVAKALNKTDIPELIGGTFSTQNTYDKKGKITGTKTFDEVLGKKYEEDANAFAQRLAAENMIYLLDAGNAAGEASKIAEKWRASSQALYDGATFLVQAQIDINNGHALLALGEHATIKATDDFVESMQQAGETIAQTYDRLQKASAAYLSDVAQIDAQLDALKRGTGTNFEQSIMDVNNSVKQWTDELNAAAIAAGLTAAKTEDLVKVQQIAALSYANIIRQLGQQIQAEVFDLFGTPLSKQAKSYRDTADALDPKIQALLAQGGYQLANDLLLKQKDFRDHADYLQKLQDEQQAQAERAAKANAFSQDIADFAAATGSTFEEIAKKFGFSLSDLADALGLSPADLDSYLTKLESQATAFIDLKAIQEAANQYLSQILDAIRGGSGKGSGTIVKDTGPITYTPKAQPSLMAAGSDISAGDSSEEDFRRDVVRLLTDGNSTRKDQFQEIQRTRLDAERRARTQIINPPRARVPD